MARGTALDLRATIQRRGWSVEERSRWGFSYHGQAILGPVFLDINILLNAGIGGELSIGLGVMLSP